MAKNIKFMNNYITINNRYLADLCLIVLFSIIGCSEDQQTTVTESQSSFKTSPADEQGSVHVIDSLDNEIQPTQKQFKIGNKRYLFDVTNHSMEELKDLLARIEEITELSPESFDQLEMVMVLHGPDIDLFRQSNYSENKQLVDLAAKLDKFKVVDMKVCETAMGSLGVGRDDMPPFIELVPYAPDTIRRLEQEGYINL